MEEGVSVIVPIYNTDINLLKECIESIRNQTYTNLEIVLVDDGSTYDNIKMLMEEYEKKDNRIKCIYKSIVMIIA